MQRRGFLGTIIGAVAASPFLALLGTDPWQRVTDDRFRMLFRTEEGFIQAPGVKLTLETNYSIAGPDIYRYIFEAEKFEASQKLKVYGVRLLGPDGEPISDRSFATVCILHASDSLLVTDTLTSPFKSFEKTIEGFRAEKPLIWS